MIVGKTGEGLLYAVRRGGSAVAYCSLSVRCGTRDEGDFPPGIAHFLEHTLFKGTSKKSASAINCYLDRLGGELNAFTGKEKIVIHATVLKEDLGKAEGLLLELASRPAFPPEEIETERGVVIDEIKSYADSPADDVYDKFEEKLLAGHPLGKSILGTAASVRKIKSEDLRAFHAGGFTPDNMAMAVVADIDEKKMEEALLKAVSKAFGHETRRGAPRLMTPLSPRKPFHERVTKRNHEANAVIGCPAPSLYGGKDRFSTILYGNIIGGPASNSMLNNLLRERNGWVYGVDVSYNQFRETGVLAISLGCEKENLGKCLDAVGKIIRKTQDKPLSNSALKAAKRQLLGQLAISSDNGETQCLSMGESLLAYGTIFSSEENRARIEAVTSEDIQDIALRSFNEANTSSLIFL